MLIDNEKHRKFHAVGPKDIKWGKAKTAVCFIRVTRSTISDEQMEVNVPVFYDDTRDDLEVRLGLLMSLAQDRREDVTIAWNESEENERKTIENTRIKAGLLTQEEKQKIVEANKK